MLISVHIFHFSTEIVREHLEDYFTRSQQIIKDDRSLCLLCIQCFEVDYLEIFNNTYSITFLSIGCSP